MRNPDTMWQEDAPSNKIHILYEVDDAPRATNTAGETFCASLKDLPRGEAIGMNHDTGPWCPVCVMRAVARALFHGYADQWHSDILYDAARQVKGGA